MIHKLQRRFILITVLALTLAMVLVVGIVNVANLISVRAELANTLSLLAHNSPPDNAESPEFPAGSGGEQRSDRFSAGNQKQSYGSRAGFPWHPDDERNRHTRNMMSESSWFVAYLDAENAIQSLDLLRISQLDEDSARVIAQQALDSGKSSGWIQDYLFQIDTDPESARRLIVLDCETRMASVRNLALISGIACLGGILLALLLVSLLSRRAVRPTIRNMEQQKQFITNASHELKTPLTVISTNMELLNMETPDNPWVRSTMKQTSALAHLVDELVYLSRMEEEHPALNMESVPLSALLEETAEPFTAMAEYNGREMTVRAEPDLRVTGDRASLQRLCSTLCDNAVKYAPEGGTILAETFSDGRSAVLRLSNTVESPLTREQCDQLFNRFYRTDPSRNKERKKGFGIGLSIAAAIVEKHGGAIRAAMEDSRLVITCTLPREK